MKLKLFLFQKEVNRLVQDQEHLAVNDIVRTPAKLYLFPSLLLLKISALQMRSKPPNPRKMRQDSTIGPWVKF